MDTITQINTVDLNHFQVIEATKSISEYMDKYKNRMSPKNVKMISDLTNILKAFNDYFKKHENGSTDLTVDVMSLLTDTDLYMYDFQKLLTFFDKADLVKKLNGFISH